MPIQDEHMHICLGYSTWYRPLKKKKKLKRKVIIHAFNYIAIQVPSL